MFQTYVRRFGLIASLAVGLIAFAQPNSALAGPQCQNLSGNCVLKSLCTGAGKTDQGLQDCMNDPSNPPQTCCSAQGQGGGGPAPIQCESQSGVCLVTCPQDQESIGQSSCQAGNLCCRPKAISPSAAAPASGGGVSAPVGSDHLILPECTKTGNCTIADIVQTGVNFASFVMGLSAALFFAVFIYGGAMYLLSFGDEKRVKTGREAIKGAAIGIIFVLGAWTIVQLLVKGLGANVSGGVTGSSDKCTALGTGYSCIPLTGKTTQEAMKDGDAKGYSCKSGFCPGAANVLCCKSK